ncbi:MAG: aspartate-semialdehyde dehydrogenase [Clostridia bacterium]|nr:aspartate-semialdehyde dehydrogenase [Clostridia bacterium]
MKKNYSVGIVGATGLIGRKLLQVLIDRRFPFANIKLFASEKSVGKNINDIEVRKLDENSFVGLDLVFFCAGKEVSLKYVPIAVESGAFVIDNSSAFRQNEDIPLIIPEINMNVALKSNSRIIANPNCYTTQAILPLKNLAKKFCIKRIIMSTYQAVSGSGQKGINDLLNTKKGLKGKLYPVNISENYICKIDEQRKNGYTAEETKALNETRKILGMPVMVSSTCVRVPIENCHGVTVEAEFSKKIDLDEVFKIINSTKGIKYTELASPESADGKYFVYVSRLRKSTAFDNGIAYFTVSDNTLKGAALNAVQIAERLVKNGKI